MGKYGMITDDDAGALESCLIVSSISAKEDNIPFKVLEIGVCHGDTSRGIKNFLDSRGIPFEYYGVDNQRDRPIEIPFDGANMYLGESSEVAYRLPQSPCCSLSLSVCSYICHMMSINSLRSYC